MTAPYFLCRLTRLVLLGVLSCTPALAEEYAKAPAEQAASKSPWGGNLSLYLWLGGIKGDFTAGTRGGSVDASFIDIFGKSKRTPLGFMGRSEIHYDRFGFYVDGNYMNIQLKPKFGAISEGINTELGLMDYGLIYRIYGAKASDMSEYQGKKRPNVLDVYAGARTIWLGNSVAFTGPFGRIERTPTTGKSFTAPLIGGRVGVDFTPNWFALADGNIGGFGADNVDFTGGLMGMLGYRTSLFGVPTSVEAGYRAIRYNVDSKGPTSASATLHGPFIGLTGYW
jgi:hypothetical protein